MLFHIIKSSLEISNDITVVVAHQKDAVIEQMSAYFDDIHFIVQDSDNFPGTGGAMMKVEPKNEKVLILNGDMPLITSDALQGFLDTDADIIIAGGRGMKNAENFQGTWPGMYCIIQPWFGREISWPHAESFWF